MDILTRLSFAVASSLLILVVCQRIQLEKMNKKYEKMKEKVSNYLSDLDEKLPAKK